MQSFVRHTLKIKLYKLNALLTTTNIFNLRKLGIKHNFYVVHTRKQVFLVTYGFIVSLHYEITDTKSIRP